MIRTASTIRYVQERCEKLALIQFCVLGRNEPTVCGSARIVAAKMTGMTPAMFTRSGI